MYDLPGYALYRRLVARHSLANSPICHAPQTATNEYPIDILVFTEKKNGNTWDERRRIADRHTSWYWSNRRPLCQATCCHTTMLTATYMCVTKVWLTARRVGLEWHYHYYNQNGLGRQYESIFNIRTITCILWDRLLVRRERLRINQFSLIQKSAGY